MITMNDMAFELQPGDELLTAKQSAKLLSVSTRTIARAVKKGILPVYKIGDKAIRFKKSEVYLIVK